MWIYAEGGRVEEHDEEADIAGDLTWKDMGCLVSGCLLYGLWKLFLLACVIVGASLLVRAVELF